MKHVTIGKRFGIFFLVVMFLVALSACGGSPDTGSGGSTGGGSGGGSNGGSDPPESTYVYMRDWYFDENTHWRMCAEFTCLMAELRFEEAAHQFTYGEPEVVHGLGYTDSISVEKTCDICAASFTDHSRGDLIYGSFEYPAKPSYLPKAFLIQPEEREKLSAINHLTNFNEVETWYCSIEVEQAGQMTLLESFYYGSSKPDLTDPLRGREGEFHLYGPNKQEMGVKLANSSIHVGNSYFVFNDYTVHVEPGTYTLGIKHNYYRMGYSSSNHYSIAYQLS